MFKAEYIFVRILFPFIMGITLLYFFQNGYALMISSILSTTTFFLVLIIIIRYKYLNAYKFKGFTGILIFVFFFCFGGLLCLLKSEKLRPDYFANKEYTCLKIWINEEPEQTKGILRFKARVVSGYEDSKQIKLSGQLLIALKADSLRPIRLKYGDELIVYAKYDEVEPPYNPAEFNFKHWLASQNVYQQIFTDQAHIIKTDRNNGIVVIKFALDLREQQIAKYRRLIKNDEAFAVASTLILGYRADLSKETLAAYSKTGTIHALSVSGSHVAIIFFLLDFLLFWFNKKWYLKIVRFVLICSFIWIYSLITGLSPSVVRAAIMITIFITAKTFAKNKNGYNTLAFAAFCQLIYNPFSIWDVGFQLSYISVFGLIYLQPKIYKWVYVKNKWLNKIWELIALSLAAQLVTFPLCIYYFHQFPVYFLIGNLFISIPLILIMILGIGVLIPFVSSLSPVFEWIIVFTNSVLKWIANLPYSTLSSVWLNFPELILLCFALGLFVYALAVYKKKILMISLMVYVIYSFTIFYDNRQAIRQKKIIFYSLRKNYAVAFIDGVQAVLITDLDTQNRNYQFSIKPVLDQSLISKINLISLKQDTQMSNFLKKGNQIVFNGYNILIVDSKLNYKKLISNGKFSSLWITESTRFKPEDLSEEMDYKTILIDGTNRDYKTAAFKSFAKNNKIGYYVLKKNPAYLVNLNQ